MSIEKKESFHNHEEVLGGFTKAILFIQQICNFRGTDRTDSISVYTLYIGKKELKTCL